jgi:hypothetical protein
MQIDLFVSPGCPGCGQARRVVESFARRHPGVEVCEWDLSQGPGPATGHGIFATPTVLLDRVRVLPGVPEAGDLEAHRAATTSATPPQEG